jgi:hypothetical protein
MRPVSFLLRPTKRCTSRPPFGQSPKLQRFDLEGIVAKRLADLYMPHTVWRKIRKGAYTQIEGRRELFHRPLI